MGKIKKQLFLLVLLLTVNAVLLWHAMLHGFDPQDYGGFTNAAWRMTQGQKIYRDFHFLTVPVFMYFFSFFIAALGFGKAAIYATLLLPTLAGIALTFFLGFSEIPLGTAALTALVAAAGFSWDWPFPNYDIYSAVWILSALILFVKIHRFKPEENSFPACFLAGLFSAMAVMTKTNEGAALTLVCAVWIWVYFPGRRIQAFLGYLAGGWATCLALLWSIGDFKTFHTNIFVYYMNNQIGRASNFFHFSSWVTHGYIIPLLICIVAVRSNIVRFYREFLLLAGLTLIAVFAYASGSNKHPAHMPLMGAITAMGFLILQKNKNFRSSPSASDIWGIRALIIFCTFQIFLSTQTLYEALSSKKSHPLMGPCCNYSLKSEPLNGWKVYENWGPLVDRITPYLKQHVRPEESLLILANLQILYPLTGHLPYPGVSFQFKVREQPQPGAQKQAVVANILANPPQWILTYRDSGPFRLNVLLVDLGLDDFIFSQYDAVQDWGPYLLFRRK